MDSIHLLGLKGEELGDVEPQPDGEADKDVKQEVSPPLWQGQGHHHEHPEIENICLAAKDPILVEAQGWLDYLSKVMKRAM